MNMLLAFPGRSTLQVRSSQLAIRAARLTALCLLGSLALAGTASAQVEILPVKGTGTPPSVLPASAASSVAPSVDQSNPDFPPIDLGTVPSSRSQVSTAQVATLPSGAPVAAGAAVVGASRGPAASASASAFATAPAQTDGKPAATARTGSAARVAALARAAAAPDLTKRPAGRSSGVTERLIFDQRPITVALPVGGERLISFARPVALHVPDDADGLVQLQIIGRTVYARALAPFGTLRIVAEQIEGDNLQIPLDLVADSATGVARGDIEVIARAHIAAANAAVAAASVLQAEAAGPAAAPDPVVLTRYAARMLYAPMRLAGGNPLIRQVEVTAAPVPGLLRGLRVQAIPVGAWRSGSMWVTAVRLTNQEAVPVDISLEDVRGRWISAATQHGRLGRAGTDTDTTALYLVCDGPFEACR